VCVCVYVNLMKIIADKVCVCVCVVEIVFCLFN